MSFSVFKIFQVFGIVSSWATQALADGKVTLVEAVDLVTKLCLVLGVVTELQLPGIDPPEEEVIEQASLDLGDASEETDQTSPDRAPPDEASPKLAPLNDLTLGG